MFWLRNTCKKYFFPVTHSQLKAPKVKILAIQILERIARRLCLFVLMPKYVPVNNFSVMLIFLGLTSTKQSK